MRCVWRDRHSLEMTFREHARRQRKCFCSFATNGSSWLVAGWDSRPVLRHFASTTHPAADLQLQRFIGAAAETLQRTADSFAVPLTRVRAFAEAEVQAHAATPGEAAPPLGQVRLRFELESEASRGALDRLLLLLAKPAIASEAASCGAGVALSLEHLLPLDTDM
jgi:hypothetical protein